MRQTLCDICKKAIPLNKSEVPIDIIKVALYKDSNGQNLVYSTFDFCCNCHTKIPKFIEDKIKELK